MRATPLLVGVRHILDVEEEDWLLREEVARGLQVLEQEDKVFDCLVRPPTLKHVATIGEILVVAVSLSLLHSHTCFIYEANMNMRHI